jgi:hypothetical protein
VLILLAIECIAIVDHHADICTCSKDFGQQTGNSLTWTVDIPAGQSVGFKIVDSTGSINYGAPVTICASPAAQQQPLLQPGVREESLMFFSVRLV